MPKYVERGIAMEQWKEISRERICSLPDKKIFLQGKKQNESFLQRCLIRTDRILAEEQAAREAESCRLLAQRAEAMGLRLSAEQNLLKAGEEGDVLRRHKKEVRLKKRMMESEARIRQCETALELLQCRFTQRQSAWEGMYKEIETLYRQGEGEGAKVYELESQRNRI